MTRGIRSPFLQKDLFMNGVYGGLIVIIMYAGSPSIVIENLFLYLDGTPFTLLSGEHLTLL